MEHKGRDITGQRFGRLVAIEPIGRDKQGYIIWRCKCDCGNEKSVTTKYLGKGTSSCGCFSKEVHDKARTKHGKRFTRLYAIHKGIKDRCLNPNHPTYKNYGNRGIKICDEWLNDFEAFEKWALANGYDENAPKGQCTLDRIDVNGNYEPSNCRFVSMKEQERNKRNNVLITYNGETHCMSEWAEMAGLKYITFQHRLYAGWSMEDALNKPLAHLNR